MFRIKSYLHGNYSIIYYNPHSKFTPSSLYVFTKYKEYLTDHSPFECPFSPHLASFRKPAKSI